MTAFIIRRLGYMIPTLIVISLVSFIIINLPPGTYLDVRLAELQRQGSSTAREQIAQLRRRFALDRPVYVQYLNWVSGFIRGDFGRSFAYRKPVAELIGERLALTVTIALSTLFFTWLVAIPIGIYSATHQYSVGDHFFTLLGFLGLSTPNFLLALILLVVGFSLFGTAPLGLFSKGMADAPWSLAKVVDLLKHLWVPVVVVGTAGTASLIRIMRSNLLDILGKQFVNTARSKGLPETIVIIKHAVRIAINPLVSLLGMQFPRIISGSTIAAIVLSLPTCGPLFFEALQQQDMYLAGTFLLFLSFMLVLGNFFADIALAVLDPRIRYD